MGQGQRQTLYDVLMEIYVQYGFSREVTVNVVKRARVVLTKSRP